MNAILEQIIESRNGMYCHALEVSDSYELESIVEQLFSEFADEHDKEIIIDFFQSMELYCLDDENEDEVFNFDFESYINELV